MVDPLARKPSRNRGLSRAWGDFSRIRPHSPPDDSGHAKSLELMQPQLTNYLQTVSSFPLRPDLKGLDNGCRREIDFYQPVIRQFRNPEFPASDQGLNCIRHPPVIEPVHTVTVWKSLTLSDCDSLTSIQYWLKACLEQLLEGQFTFFRAQLLSAWRSNCQESSKGSNCVETLVSHRFVINKAQLIQALFEALHIPEEIHNPDDERRIEELLMLYLWSRDCMIDLPPNSGQTAINARLLCYIDSKTCCPQLRTVTALWTPDYLSFEGLDVLPQEDSEISIKPYYRTNAPQGPGGPHTKVTYSLGSDHPWLCWDTEAGAFRGRLPRFSQNPRAKSGLSQVYRLERQGLHANVNLLKVEVKALIVVAYPGSKVRLERTIRVRVALRILPSASTLGPLKFSAFPYQSNNLCPDSKIFTLSQQRIPKIEHEQISGDPNPKVDASSPLVTGGLQSDAVEPVDSEISDSIRHVQGGQSGPETGTDAPPLPTDTQASKLDLPVLDAGLEARPNASLSPPTSRKKWPYTYHAFSNVPGINLQALAAIWSQRNRLVLREANTSYTTKRVQLSNSSAAKENRCNAAAEAFDAEWSPRKSKQWKRGSRYVGPVVCVRPSQLGTWETSSHSHAERFQLQPQTPHDAKTFFHIDKLGSDSRRYYNTAPGARKRNIRSIVDMYASAKRRQDRSSKTTPFREELRFIQSMSGRNTRQCSTQTSITDGFLSEQASATKHHQGSSIVWTPSHSNTHGQDTVETDLTPPSTLTLGSTTPQTIVLSNRYAPLQNLSQHSDAEWSSDDSGSELSQSPTQLSCSRQAHRHLDSACYVGDAFNSCALENTGRGKHEGRFSPQQAHSIKSDHGQRSQGPKLLPHNLADSCTVPSPKILARPIYSCSTNDNIHGGDSYTDKSRRVVYTISTMKEALEAYREPGLSNDEREQTFEAMKKSLQTEATSRSCSGLVSTDIGCWDEEAETSSDTRTDGSTATERDEKSNEEVERSLRDDWV
ncbi:MAG: hypothetical protein LQ343_004085 [Gyalolechia ehrenbergii]|nr:MAG: hypothetical protein LQ343_004085 [Gyalolechia ehrenbergii]